MKSQKLIPFCTILLCSFFILLSTVSFASNQQPKAQSQNSGVSIGPDLIVLEVGPTQNSIPLGVLITDTRQIGELTYAFFFTSDPTIENADCTTFYEKWDVTANAGGGPVGEISPGQVRAFAGNLNVGHLSPGETQQAEICIVYGAANVDVVDWLTVSVTKLTDSATPTATLTALPTETPVTTATPNAPTEPILDQHAYLPFVAD